MDLFCILHLSCWCWITHIHLHVSPPVRGAERTHTLPCFVCRLRRPLGLWGRSAGTRPPRLPSSLTHIVSTSASPPTASAPTKASPCTSRPEVLWASSSLPSWWKGLLLFEVCWRLVTNSLSDMLIAGKVCQAVVTSHSTVTPQQPEYHPGEKVTVACDLGHVVNTVSEQEPLIALYLV